MFNRLLISIILVLVAGSCKPDETNGERPAVVSIREVLFENNMVEPESVLENKKNKIRIVIDNPTDEEILINRVSDIENDYLKFETLYPSNYRIKPKGSGWFYGYLVTGKKSASATEKPINESFSLSYKVLPDGPIKQISGKIAGDIKWVSKTDLDSEMSKNLKIDKIQTSDQIRAYKVKNNTPYTLAIFGIRDAANNFIERKSIDYAKSTCLGKIKDNTQFDAGSECEVWLNIPKDKTDGDFHTLTLLCNAEGHPFSIALPN